jgi:polyhydroxyalkanoic acid synthase PhaR subunit
MSEQKPEKPQFDPFAPWKAAQATWIEGWSQAMSQAVSSEDFAKAMGQYLDQYLEASAPMRRQVEQAMEKYLQQMSVPTRNEVLSLAERLTNLEMRIDDLDAKMDEVLDRLAAIRAALPGAQES